QPGPANADARIVRKLLGPIVACVGGRQYLTDPIRHDSDRFIFARKLWHRGASPACELWRNFGCIRQLDSGLRNNPPATRPVVIVVEGSSKMTADEPNRPRVVKPGSWLHEQLAVDDLALEMLRKCFELCPELFWSEGARGDRSHRFRV